MYQWKYKEHRGYVEWDEEGEVKLVNGENVGDLVNEEIQDYGGKNIKVKVIIKEEE